MVINLGLFVCPSRSEGQCTEDLISEALGSGQSWWNSDIYGSDIKPIFCFIEP